MWQPTLRQCGQSMTQKTTKTNYHSEYHKGKSRNEMAKLAEFSPSQLFTLGARNVQKYYKKPRICILAS
jgi:hypothetical protein